MSDLRDPAIKLFGTTIPLAAEDVATGSGSDLPSDVILEEQGEDAHEETNLEQATESQPDPLDSVPHGEANPSSEPSTTNQTVQEESVPDKTGTPNQDKTLKKPDKILPCPRCKSMDTKFCYYNNYNVNQPRHFCKKCQRYWTAGGTMRNVPVGAGRRKNKHLNNRLLTGTGTEVAEQVPVIPPPNGSVMKFGPEMPLSESMVSGLNIKERENKAVSVTGTSTGTVAASSLSEEKNGCNRVAPVQLPVPVPPVPFYPGAPFVYPWNGSPIPLSVPPPVMPPGTGFGPPGVPFPFVPAPFWAFGWAPPQWVPGSPASSTSTITTSTGTGSPALGKHSRNGTVPGDEKSEKNLWVPKTLRIDDPAEAAKSSIWDTLGIKKEERGILGAFRGKSEMRGPVRIGTSRLLHANPAALSRSQSFQEST